MSISDILTELKTVQAKLVKALQEEYFCDDLEPPAVAYGWDEERLREFFETGGDSAPVVPAGKLPPAPVEPGQTGGGRKQLDNISNPPQDIPELAPNMKVLVGGDGVEAALKYQAVCIEKGIPDLTEGLFPPEDPLIKKLSAKYKPYIKVLPCATTDGGAAYMQVENGWVAGNNACAHGMDLRLFIAPGKEPKLYAALRYSDYACIGRGFAGTSVHGGAVESALDEATAECAKSKLFPVATTVVINFKIQKALRPQVTYLVECEMTKEHSKNLKYDITGKILDAADGKTTLATCVATMANPAQIPGAGYD